MIREVKVGEQFPDLLHHRHLLPVGSKISSNIRVAAPGLLLDGSGSVMDSYYLNSPQMLAELPEGESITIPRETEAQFKWRLRDAALAAAERAGVHIDPVIELLRDIGASTPLFTIGGTVSNRVDIRQLPRGTVVYSGHPDKPAYLTVWQVGHERQLVRVLGHQERGNGVPVTIYSAPELPPVEQTEVAEETALARIALTAWRVGKSYKRRQSWCSTFENTLASLGINDSSIAEGTGESLRGVGDHVSRDQAALLPEGTLLWWQWQNDSRKWALYQRRNTARNSARTVRIAGFGDLRTNNHQEMIVIKTPTEEMVWNVNSSVLQNMPDGVRYMAGGWPEIHTLGPERRVSWGFYRIVSWPGVA